MVTQDMKQRASLSSIDESVALTDGLIEQFLNSLKANGRQPQTVRTYRRGLVDLYEFLPEEKEVTKEILDDWREFLKKSGYSDNSINTKLAAVNSLLRYCGEEELLVSHERIGLDEYIPELTREEYLRFLAKVCEIGSEKYYVLIRVLASVDLSIGELNYLTVESCREGVIYLPDGKIVSIPCCLREELLQYADHHEILKGPIFVSREGNPMDRSNITRTIHRLAVDAGMEPDKCSPRALHRLCLTTQKELREQMNALFEQTYESLLNTEQAMVAWR